MFIKLIILEGIICQNNLKKVSCKKKTIIYLSVFERKITNLFPHIGINYVNLTIIIRY